jgi:hypothetical protein
VGPHRLVDIGRRLRRGDDLGHRHRPDDAVRQPAGGDEGGDRRRALQHTEDAAAGKPPLQPSRGIGGRGPRHALGAGKRHAQFIAGSEIRHHARRGLRPSGQKRLDLDAAGDVDLVVDIGVEVDIRHGIDSCCHDGPPTILRWFFAFAGAASISRSAARALKCATSACPAARRWHRRLAVGEAFDGDEVQRRTLFFRQAEKGVRAPAPGAPNVPARSRKIANPTSHARNSLVEWPAAEQPRVAQQDLSA